jgi:hypothetical protein
LERSAKIKVERLTTSKYIEKVVHKSSFYRDKVDSVAGLYYVAGLGGELYELYGTPHCPKEMGDVLWNFCGCVKVFYPTYDVLGELYGQVYDPGYRKSGSLTHHATTRLNFICCEIAGLAHKYHRADKKALNYKDRWLEEGNFLAPFDSFIRFYYAILLNTCGDKTPNEYLDLIVKKNVVKLVSRSMMNYCDPYGHNVEDPELVTQCVGHNLTKNKCKYCNNNILVCDL